MTTSMNKTVQLQLTTQIEQAGEIQQHQFIETAQAVYLNAAWYLRYQEHLEGQVTPVTIKLADDGQMQLTRGQKNNGQTYVTLLFDTKTRQQTHYHTPYGAMLLEVQTKKAIKTLNELPFSGEIQLEYELTQGSEFLGRYKLELIFNE